MPTTHAYVSMHFPNRTDAEVTSLLLEQLREADATMRRADAALLDTITADTKSYDQARDTAREAFAKAQRDLVATAQALATAMRDAETQTVWPTRSVIEEAARR